MARLVDLGRGTYGMTVSGRQQPFAQTVMAGQVIGSMPP